METTNKAYWVNFFKDAGFKVSQALEYAMKFTDHEIRKDMLLELNKDLLRDMDIIPLGHIIAILKQAKLTYNQELVEKAMCPSPDIRQTLPVKPMPPLSRSVVNLNTSKPLSVKSEERKTVANVTSKPSTSRLSTAPASRISTAPTSRISTAPNRKVQRTSAVSRPVKQNVQRQVIYEDEQDDNGEDDDEEDVQIQDVQEDEDMYEMEMSEVAVEKPVSRSVKSSVSVAPSRKVVSKKRKVTVPSISRTVTSSSTSQPVKRKARIPLSEEEEDVDPIEVSSTVPQVKKRRSVTVAAFSSEPTVSHNPIRSNSSTIRNSNSKSNEGLKFSSSTSKSRNETPKFSGISSTSKSRNEGPKFTLSSISSSSKIEEPKFTITGLEKLTKDPEKTCMTSVFSRLGGKPEDNINLEDEMEEEEEEEDMEIIPVKSKPLPYAGILKKPEVKTKVNLNKVSKTMIADKVTTKTVVTKRLGSPAERIVSSSSSSFQVVKKFPSAGILGYSSSNAKSDVKSRLGMTSLGSSSLNKPKKVPITWTDELSSSSSRNVRIAGAGQGSTTSLSKRISVAAPRLAERVPLKDSVPQRNRLVQARSRSVSPSRARYSVYRPMNDDSSLSRRITAPHKSVTFGTVTENFFEKEHSDVFSRLG